MNLSKRRSTLGILLAGMIFLTLGFSTSAPAVNELRLQFQDEKGQPVVITKAELLLVAWGSAEKIQLKPSKDGLALPLDADWLNAHWSDAKNRSKDLAGAYLYFQAKGYASICSNPIAWPGSDAAKEVPGPTMVSFPRGPSAKVGKDGICQLTVVLRKPGRKFLRFINDRGKPVAGVRVEEMMFWSHFNQMGLLNGAEFLGRKTSGADGRVEVPDGDFTYAFRISHKKYYLLNRAKDSADPFLMITGLENPETFVVMTTQKPPEFFGEDP